MPTHTVILRRAFATDGDRCDHPGCTRLAWWVVATVTPAAKPGEPLQRTSHDRCDDHARAVAHASGADFPLDRCLLEVSA